MKPGTENDVGRSLHSYETFALALTTFVSVALGVYPQPLLDLIDKILK
jgi:NADH:ubiquinone oxidoreductase subunit 4 (subunit M)